MRRITVSFEACLVFMASISGEAKPPKVRGRDLAKSGEPQAGQGNPGRILTRPSIPGLAFQFVPCLDEEQRTNVTKGLSIAFQDPETSAPPDVRTKCTDQRNPLNGTEAIGVWLSQRRASYPYVWELGFGADHVYPVRVRCLDCPDEPGGPPQPGTTGLYETAAVERKLPGREIDGLEGGGWPWPELAWCSRRAPARRGPSATPSSYWPPCCSTQTASASSAWSAWTTAATRAGAAGRSCWSVIWARPSARPTRSIGTRPVA